MGARQLAERSMTGLGRVPRMRRGLHARGVRTMPANLSALWEPAGLGAPPAWIAATPLLGPYLVGASIASGDPVGTVLSMDAAVVAAIKNLAVNAAGRLTSSQVAQIQNEATTAIDASAKQAVAQGADPTVIAQVAAQGKAQAQSEINAQVAASGATPFSLPSFPTSLTDLFSGGGASAGSGSPIDYSSWLWLIFGGAILVLVVLEQ